MKHRLPIIGFLAIALTAASAQSGFPCADRDREPLRPKQLTAAGERQASSPGERGSADRPRPASRDVSDFPYAQQHNGFPKAQEAARFVRALWR